MIDDEYIKSKYKELKTLGQGTYGKVILAENKTTKSKVAIKYIDFDSLDKDEKNIDNVIQEATILNKLTHKNIIKFEDFNFNKERAILVMEFAEGGDLFKRIKEQQKKNQPFNEKIIITWFLELCNAVKYDHDKNILHRDLKQKIYF